MLQCKLAKYGIRRPIVSRVERKKQMSGPRNCGVSADMLSTDTSGHTKMPEPFMVISAIVLLAPVRCKHDWTKGYLLKGSAGLQ